MSRQIRKLSKTGLYHVIFRGINRQNIFEEENDYEQFIKILKDVKKEKAFEIYTYCLMSNHVHLLIHENEIGDISNIMQRLLTRYAGWYNKKYLRSGTLFGDRYKSEPVEKDSYLLSLVRYIHQNPKKARLVTKLEDYPWSSYCDYTSNSIKKDLVEISYILKTLSQDQNEAVRGFIEFHDRTEDHTFEISKSPRKTEEEVRKIIIKKLKGDEPHFIARKSKTERNKIIKSLREENGLSIRQIERATGISRGVIARVK